MAQVVEKPAIGQAFQAIGRHGRARNIAAEALEAVAIPGGDGDVGVQREAHGGGAAGCCGCRQILGVDAVTAPGGAPAAGGESADRVGGETCEGRLRGGQWVRVGGVGVRAEAAALHEAGSTERCPPARSAISSDRWLIGLPGSLPARLKAAKSFATYTPRSPTLTMLSIGRIQGTNT